MPTKHDPWGCSRHEPLLNCLGFISGPPGTSADEGTEMHAIAEEIINSGWEKYNYPDVFQTGNPFTDEHVHIVSSYTNEIRRLKKAYEKKYGDQVEMYIEHEIKIPALDIQISTIDCLFVVPFKFIHVIDLKTGVSHNSPSSAQIKGYMLGAMNEFPASNFAGSIFQPMESDTLMTAQFSKRELEKHRDMMEMVLLAAKRVNAPCTPCQYCNWCDRAGTCPSTKSQVAMLEMTATKTDLSNTSLAVLAAYAMEIEKTVGSLKQRAHAILEAGGELKHPDGRELMLVDGRPKRVWQNEKAARDMLINLTIEQGKADSPEEAEEIIFEIKKTMLSPSKTEKVFGKSKQIRDQIEPQVFKKPGNKKLTLVKNITGENDE